MQELNKRGGVGFGLSFLILCGLTSSRELHDVFLVNGSDVVVVALDPCVAFLLHPRHIVARVGRTPLVRQNCLHTSSNQEKEKTRRSKRTNSYL